MYNKNQNKAHKVENNPWSQNLNCKNKNGFLLQNCVKSRGRQNATSTKICKELGCALPCVPNSTSSQLGRSFAVQTKSKFIIKIFVHTEINFDSKRRDKKEHLTWLSFFFVLVSLFVFYRFWVSWWVLAIVFLLLAGGIFLLQGGLMVSWACWLSPLPRSW